MLRRCLFGVISFCSMGVVIKLRGIYGTMVRQQRSASSAVHVGCRSPGLGDLGVAACSGYL